VVLEFHLYHCFSFELPKHTWKIKQCWFNVIFVLYYFWDWTWILAISRWVFFKHNLFFICVHVLMCVILLVSIVLGHDLVAHDNNGNNIMTCTQCFGWSTPFKWCGIESLDCTCVMICKRAIKRNWLPMIAWSQWLAHVMIFKWSLNLYCLIFHIYCGDRETISTLFWMWLTMVGQIGCVIGNAHIMYVWGFVNFFCIKNYVCKNIRSHILVVCKNNNSINFILVLILLSKSKYN
jgi:hypothetical protein